MGDSPRVHPVDYFSVSSPALSVCFCRNDEDDREDLVAVGDAEGRLHLWNLRTWRSEAVVRAFGSGVLWTGYCHGILFALGKLSGLKAFTKGETADWEELPIEVTGKMSALEPHEGFCRGDLYPEESLVAVPSRRSALVVAKFDSGAERRVIVVRIVSVAEGQRGLDDEKCGLVTSARFAGKRLLATYESASLAVWDWPNETVLCKISLEKPPTSSSVPLSLDFDASCNRGVVGGTGDRLVSFALGDDGGDSPLEVLCRRTLPTKGLAHVRVLGRVVAAGSWDSTVRIFSWKKPERLKPLGALKFHGGTVEAVACSDFPVTSKVGGRRLLCAASKDGKVSFWDLPTVI